MAHTTNPITALVETVEQLGQRRAGRAAVSRWGTSEPALVEWATAGEVASACRSTRFAAQDQLIESLLRVAAGDELAQLTVVAGLADRLRSIARRWARAGVPDGELQSMEADLVAECWAATSRLAGQVASGHPLPARLGLRLADAAVEAVRVPRRRDRRHAARTVPLTHAAHGMARARTAADELALEVADAVRAGRLSLTAARPVFLTRVAGFDVADAAKRLGCTPGVVRAVRSRAERRMVAA